jgi:hypothetical protein
VLVDSTGRQFAPPDVVGLVSYWPMADGSGATFLDQQGHSNGTLSSSGLWSGDFVTFNGSTDYGIIPSIALYHAGTTQTVFGWVNGAAQSGRYIFSQYDAALSQGAWAVRSGQAATDKLFVVLSDDGVNNRKFYVGSQTCFDSTWHSFCFRWNVGTLDLFVDGAIDNSITKSVDTPMTGNAIFFSPARLGVATQINGNTPGANLFAGSINRLRFYNTSLLDVDIAALHALGH